MQKIETRKLELQTKLQIDKGILESPVDYELSTEKELSVERLLEKMWADAEIFADLIEQLPEQKLWENIADEKYGNYYRNLCGIIEHFHYHLGQIVLIKKILLQRDEH